MDDMERAAFKDAVKTLFTNRYHIQHEGDIADIQRMADTVLNYFMSDKMANDDDIEPDLRGIFYLLEDLDLLKMDITEKHLVDGRVWRKHFWILNKNRIHKIMQNMPGPEVREPPEPYGVYSMLPDSLWQRRM